MVSLRWSLNPIRRLNSALFIRAGQTIFQGNRFSGNRGRLMARTVSLICRFICDGQRRGESTQCESGSPKAHHRAGFLPAFTYFASPADRHWNPTYHARDRNRTVHTRARNRTLTIQFLMAYKGLSAKFSRFRRRYRQASRDQLSLCIGLVLVMTLLCAIV
jgi:hypothetical protein